MSILHRKFYGHKVEEFSCQEFSISMAIPDIGEKTKPTAKKSKTDQGHCYCIGQKKGKELHFSWICEIEAKK